MFTEGYSNVQVKLVHGDHPEKAINDALKEIKGTIVNIQLLDYKDTMCSQGTALITYVPDPMTLMDKKHMALNE